MTYLSDLYAALKGDFIALDETEAALIDAPPGETVSLYAAFEAKHGAFWAHVMCGILWIAQAHHCKDQMLGIPMKTWNYIRAAIMLVTIPAGMLYVIILIICELYKIL